MEYNSISINYPILKYLSLETSDKINNKKQRTDKKEEKSQLHSKNYREKLFHIKYQKSAALYTHLRRIFNGNLTIPKKLNKNSSRNAKYSTISLALALLTVLASMLSY